MPNEGVGRAVVFEWWAIIAHKLWDDALGQDLLLFPNAGHGAVTSSTCARDIWFAFLDDPTTTPDTACMDDLGPPDFG